MAGRGPPEGGQPSGYRDVGLRSLQSEGPGDGSTRRPPRRRWCLLFCAGRLRAGTSRPAVLDRSDMKKVVAKRRDLPLRHPFSPSTLAGKWDIAVGRGLSGQVQRFTRAGKEDPGSFFVQEKRPRPAPVERQVPICHFEAGHPDRAA